MSEQKECATCGVSFTPRRSGGKPQVRCSEKCRRKVANRKYIKKNAPVRTAECAECGGPVVQAELGRPRRFCASRCKARFMSRRASRARLPVPEWPKRTCPQCGDGFIPRRADQIYCSASKGDRRCTSAAYYASKKSGGPSHVGEQVKTCNECGIEFTARKSNARWCSAKCRNRYRGRVASRRRGPVSAESETYSDREIFIRDGWQCHICLRPVDPAVPRTDSEGATVDHLVPLVFGGPDRPDNVATAHNRCNREKGIKIKVRLDGEIRG